MSLDEHVDIRGLRPGLDVPVFFVSAAAGYAVSQSRIGLGTGAGIALAGVAYRSLMNGARGYFTGRDERSERLVEGAFVGAEFGSAAALAGFAFGSGLGKFLQ